MLSERQNLNSRRSIKGTLENVKIRLIGMACYFPTGTPVEFEHRFHVRPRTGNENPKDQPEGDVNRTMEGTLRLNPKILQLPCSTCESVGSFS